jgi:hypothetical protein
MAEFSLTKFCNGCKQELPRSAFWLRPEKGPNALRSRCKECMNKQLKDWAQTPNGIEYFTRKEASLKRKEQKRICHKEYRNTAEYKVRRKERRQQAQNVAKEQAYYYSDQGRQVRLKALRKYRKTDKGRMASRINSHNRRTLGGEFSKADIDRQLIAQKKRCYYCCELFSITLPYTVEHIIAVSRGGTNDPYNLLLACGRCNSSKRNKPWHPITGQGLLL